MTRPDGEQPAQPEATGQVERLLRELAGKDRQLRDLTEQALGFLEELAETRRRLHDREALARRVGHLEGLQADLSRRLRHAGGSVVGRVEEEGAGPRPALEVVFWGGTEAAAAALAARKTVDLPVSWVGRPDAVPDQGPDGGSVQWLAHRDAYTPAQCWNLGMAATRAEAVLFLGPGVELQSGSLPAAIPANVVILCPRAVAGKTAWSGCDEQDHLLRLRPRPAPAAPAAIPFASPRAFVIRRLAFEQLGMFQEDLLGTGALLEFTLRARTHNFEVLAMPQLTVHATARAWEELLDEHQDGDRLMVIATHRPESLGRALADAPVLWKMDQEQVPGYLARLLARIPAESNVRLVLEHIALGLIEHALPVADAIELVGRHRLELLGALAQEVGRDHGQVADALQRAGTDRPSSAASAFRELGEDLALERRVWTAMIHELERSHAERAAHDLQQVAAQLGQVQAERDAHQQSLQQLRPELEQVAAERDAHQQELQLVRAQVAAVTGERDGYQQALQQVQSDFQQMQGRQQELHKELQKELEQARARIAATTRERDGSRQELAASQKQLEQVQAQLQQVRSELQQVEQECQQAQRDLLALQGERVALAAAAGVPGSPDPDRLRKQIAQLHRDAGQLAAALAATGTADAEALVRLLQHAKAGEAQSLKMLDERNGWIALLLQEVTRRRLVPRKLLEHEQAFLEHLKP